MTLWGRSHSAILHRFRDLHQEERIGRGMPSGAHGQVRTLVGSSEGGGGSPPVSSLIEHFKLSTAPFSKFSKRS